MATTKEFFAHVIKNGLSPTNRFQILIPLPNGMQSGTNNTAQSRPSSFHGSTIITKAASYFGGGNTAITRGLDIMAEGTEIPGKNLASTDVKYNSATHTLPYGTVYTDIEFVFKCSKDLFEKNIIDDWMGYIIDPATSEVRYMDEYVTDIIINQLDNQDNVVYSVTLKDAYPTLCNPMGVSNADRDTFHLLNTTFAYTTWVKTHEDVPSQVSALSQTPLAPFTNKILSNPAVQKGLEVFERETGIDLEGEAVGVYNQVDGIVKNTTGESINKSVGLIEGIKASTQINDRISNEQKAKVIGIIDETLSGLKG